MPCPPSLLDPPVTSVPTRLTVDVAVVGAGAAGAATAWHLARRGLQVVLLERRAAGEVWRAAGAVHWSENGLSGGLADEACRLWRLVERDTGATLLHVAGGHRQVRADQAVAALTAAATAWGALLRHCDPVAAVETGVDDPHVRVRTGTADVRARRVLLAGRGPGALAPAGSGSAPVAAVAGRGSFAVPALAAGALHHS